MELERRFGLADGDKLVLDLRLGQLDSAKLALQGWHGRRKQRKIVCLLNEA